jgi:hypothetical protein
MPKKVDYRDELESLKREADHAMRPLSTRISVECLRKLYRLCDREGLDLGAVVRKILEEQADLYLEATKYLVGRSGKENRAMLSAGGASIMLQLPQEVRELASKVCEGLVLDLPTLLQLIITEAMPSWVVKASKARHQRQQALHRLENQLTPEKAVWETYFHLAPDQYTSYFRILDTFIERGEIELDLDEEAQLFLLLNMEMTSEIYRNQTNHPAIVAMHYLLNAKILVREDIYEGSGSKWRLEGIPFRAPAACDPMQEVLEDHVRRLDQTGAFSERVVESPLPPLPPPISPTPENETRRTEQAQSSSRSRRTSRKHRS